MVYDILMLQIQLRSIGEYNTEGLTRRFQFLSGVDRNENII